MHTLARLMPLFFAFTLGAAVCEIKNLRSESAAMQKLYQDRDGLIFFYENALADQRVDTEINYFDGYRHGYMCATEHARTGYSTSHHCATVAQPRK